MKALQAFFIVITLFITTQSFAINHRAEIQKAKTWADTFEKAYPIHIFNRDEITYLFLKEGALGEGDQKQRMEIIDRYIQEKVGIALTENDLSNLETYLFVLNNSAVALPLTEGYGKDFRYKMCAVFPNAPNGNARIESERILGLLTKEVYPEHDYEQLTQKLSFEELYLFSLYHEVSHCLDQTFMPETYINSENSHGVHQSESFAETLAYLGLIDRLGKDMAGARVLYRILYSRLMGEYFAKNPALGFGHPHFVKGGAVYYLAPVLFDAYDRVNSHTIKVAELNPQELLDVATDIVDKSSLHFRSFSAIARGLGEGMEKIVGDYEEMAFDSPELFLKAYEELLVYDKVTNLWVKNAFDMSIQPQSIYKIAPSVPYKDLCETVREGNKQEFLGILDDYRLVVQTGIYSPASMQNVYESLNDLGARLAENCL